MTENKYVLLEKRVNADDLQRRMK